MSKPLRPWDPNAPSLLWAHEIRRENIHLINQLDNTRADLATAIETIADLQQRVNELTQQTLDQKTTLQDTLHDLEIQFETKLGTMRERIECLETENRGLRMRLDASEQGCSRHARERYTMEESIRTRVLDEVRIELGRIPGVLRMRTERTCLGSDVLVPDSMPMESGSGPVGGRDALRTLSDTTWGSESQGEGVVDGFGGNGGLEESGVDLGGVMRQGGRSIAEYLADVEGMKPGLALQMAEEEILGAFVRGLDDLSVRILVEKEMNRVGWTWDAMRAILQVVIRAGESPVTITEDKMVDRGGKQSPNNGDQVKHKKRKMRRFIPIVLPDEEDNLIAMEMFRH